MRTGDRLLVGDIDVMVGDGIAQLCLPAHEPSSSLTSKMAALPPSAGEAPHRRCAESGCAPGDDGDFSIDVHVHTPVLKFRWTGAPIPHRPANESATFAFSFRGNSSYGCAFCERGPPAA